MVASMLLSRDDGYLEKEKKAQKKIKEGVVELSQAEQPEISCTS